MNTESTLTGIVAAATMGAAIFIAAPANAQTVKSIEMSYTSAELETQEGAQEVLKRIEDSARRACRSSSERPTATAYRSGQECREAAVKAAVDAISAPTLDAAIKAKETRG